MTTMPDTADVAIVGGGPAGAALAIRLADAGVSTILLERRSNRRGERVAFSHRP